MPPQSSPAVTLQATVDAARTDASRGLELISRYGVEYGLRVFGVIVVLVLAWILASWVRRTVKRTFQATKADQTLVRFLGNTTRWAIMVVALITCLQMFGIGLTSLAAVLGAAGLAIGLAMQGSLSNLAAGIMLLLLRPFRVGDVISVAGQIGTVDEIDLFTTKLDTFDNRRVLLPNGQVFGSVIENFTHHDRRRVDVNIGVEYGADIDMARAALVRAVESTSGVLKEPAPEVVLTGLGTSSVDWQLRVWCNRSDFGWVRQATIRAAKIALDEAGIGIPFPQMDVWMRQPAAPRPDESRARLDRLPKGLGPGGLPDPE